MTDGTGEADPREELAAIAAALRAYLAWQSDTGAVGIPRRPRTRAATLPRGPAEGPHDVDVSVVVESDDRAPEIAPPPEVRVDEADGPVAEAAPPRPGPPPAVKVAPVPAEPARPPVKAPPRPLPVVAEEVAACQRCALAATRTNVVFSRGNPEAQICFVGEAPGADEDAQGIPFVGRAGQLLDRMIGAMGLDPAGDVYVCNIIKCRPPGNRRPEPDEIERCIPYLHEQLAAVNPKVIVAMGNTAVSALLGTKLGITRVRGQWKLYKGKVPVMPTYHPSYLLRASPQLAEAKRQAWEDLQSVMKELGLPPKGGR